jgi:hypothetical protein
MGGGIHFRFPSWTEWIDGCCSGGVGSLLVCQDHVAKWRRCRLRRETSVGVLVGPIKAPHSRSPPCRSLLWYGKGVSPWPRHLFGRRTVHWRLSRKWLGGAEEFQDVFFEVTSKQIHGLPYWHLGEERHNVEADQYVMSVDQEWTQNLDKLYGVFMWCGEWPVWPLSRRDKCWAKRLVGKHNGIYNGS